MQTKGRHVIYKVLYMNIRRNESLYTNNNTLGSSFCSFSSSPTSAAMSTSSSSSSEKENVLQINKNKNKNKSKTTTTDDIKKKKIKKITINKSNISHDDSSTSSSSSTTTSPELSSEALVAIIKAVNEQLKQSKLTLAKTISNDSNTVASISTNDVESTVTINDQTDTSFNMNNNNNNNNDISVDVNHTTIVSHEIDINTSSSSSNNDNMNTITTTATSMNQSSFINSSIPAEPSRRNMSDESAVPPHESSTTVINTTSSSKTTSSTVSSSSSLSPLVTTKPSDTCIRLSKYISDTGLCSRRQAEEWIFNKRVAINDLKNIITSPSYQLQINLDKVYLDQQILKHNKKGKSNIFYLQPKLWAVYKLRGELVAVKDEVKNRPVIYDRLKFLIPEMAMPPPSLSSSSKIPTDVNTIPFASAIAAYERSYSQINHVNQNQNDDDSNDDDGGDNAVMNSNSSNNNTAKNNNIDTTSSTNTNSITTSNTTTSNTTTDETILKKPSFSSSSSSSSSSYLRPVIYQEFNTEGLCLFSNNPILARILSQQEATMIKTYRIKLNGLINESKIFGLKKGMFINGKRQPSIELKVESSQNTMSWCILTTYENSSKVIKNCLEFMHFNVLRMICIGFGPYNIKDLNLSLEPAKRGKETVRVVEVKITPEILQSYRNR